MSFPTVAGAGNFEHPNPHRPVGSMQKILIIGAGSLGVAAQLSSLASRQDLPLVFMGSADFAPVTHQHVDVAHYGPIPYTHSFEGSYYPTRAEEDWFDQVMDRGQWAPAPSVVPAVVAEAKSVGSGWITVSFDFPGESRPANRPPGPSRQARKAARRRQKAGRKACR